MPVTLAQPEDWTEPGAHPVARGIYRVPLPLPLFGLTAINAYILEGRDGLIVIDPGWAGPENERAMSAALRTIGYRLNDIEACLSTHHHGDHFSQAFAWRGSLGSKLYTGREERHSLASFPTAVGRFPNHPPLLDRCGAPELARRIAGKASDAWHNTAFGMPDGWLDNGDVIRLRKGSLQVIATPGHTRGHIVLHEPVTRLLFSGDHILPHITPSIGIEWAPERYPLRSYLQSLELVRGLPDTALLPAHGPVTCSTNARITELLQHHRERLDEVCELVAAGHTTAYQVARSMPWTRRGRRWEQLPVEHQLCAVMEISAHLDVLAMHGRLHHDDSAAARHYALAG
ncbi:MBL fold metallo-hydrolase [Nocardia amikacinitolerans]|uniref:MBL fold metallo-hydrolase n=1 Tax=Nocardia amikacinitolerans TaxID=756689 RepID=UPI0020A496A1|nr:MBL fold metallo-hydrolase [Nocardia amikacinitolerans]MCP2288334.1 Glyoxylase, beta-lactamase superfamily II [Nocardia amikacinitolerans]